MSTFSHKWVKNLDFEKEVRSKRYNFKGPDPSDPKGRILKVLIPRSKRYNFEGPDPQIQKVQFYKGPDPQIQKVQFWRSWSPDPKGTILKVLIPRSKRYNFIKVLIPMANELH